MRRILGAVTMLLAAVAGMTACDSGATSGGPGQITVLLTDAPFPFDSVKSAHIYIVRIDAKQAATTDVEAEDASNGGWTTLASPNSAIDLLALDNGVTLNLGTATVPSGTWESFRVVIDPSQSYVTLKDDSRPDIKWPSAGQSGIKILLAEPVVVASNLSTMVVDFDVGASFVLRGNSIRNNGLLFKPVVHAVATDISASFSGTVRGDSPTGAPIANATVELLKPGTLLTDTDAANVLRSTATDANGAFSFSFVLPGSYAVRVTPPSGSAYKAALLSGGLTLTNQQVSTGTVIVLAK